MSKYYLTVVYEVDGAVAARTILDARPWKASSHAHAIHDCDAARLEIASLHAQLEVIGAGGVEPLRKRCLHQISEPGQAQPVAAQSKFIDAAEWAQCSVEHAQMVLAKPSEWAGYEVRYLYAAPQPAAQALDARDGERWRAMIQAVLDGDEAIFSAMLSEDAQLTQAKTLDDVRAMVDRAIAAQQGGA